METYVRQPTSNDVYLAEGFNTWDINKEARDWRDKTICRADKDAINQLTFEYAKDKFILVKLDTINWIVNRDSANNSTVNSLFSSLSNLRTEDFVDTTVSLSQPIFNFTRCRPIVQSIGLPLHYLHKYL
jgi:hypothetical protein